MSKSKVYFAHSNRSDAGEIAVVNTELKKFDIEVISQRPGESLTDTLRRAEYLIILPETPDTEEWVHVGKGLYDMIVNFSGNDEYNTDNIFVVTSAELGEEVQLADFESLEPFDPSDWKQQYGKLRFNASEDMDIFFDKKDADGQEFVTDDRKKLEYSIPTQSSKKLLLLLATN